MSKNEGPDPQIRINRIVGTHLLLLGPKDGVWQLVLRTAGRDAVTNQLQETGLVVYEGTEEEVVKGMHSAAQTVLRDMCAEAMHGAIQDMIAANVVRKTKPIILDPTGQPISHTVNKEDRVPRTWREGRNRG